MKQWLTVCLCVLLLLSLTACGGGPECDLPLPEDADYRYGTEQLELGNLAKAYGYFKDSADPRAAEMLEKFVFVPTQSAVQHPVSGRDTVTTYTYDERGNLLAEETTGNSDWATPLETYTAYTYDPQDRVVSRSYRNDNIRYLEFYTYYDNGEILSYIHTSLDENGDNVDSRSSGYNRIFDQRGNVVKEEHFDIYDAACNYTLTFTYDEQDRILTRTYTDYGGIAETRTYDYDGEGNYHYTYIGGTYTQTSWYDKDGRFLKSETTDHATGEVVELSEYRFDDRGNEIYYRSRHFGDETFRSQTYNKQGKLLKSETTKNGEIYARSTRTYDQNGNELTYEYFNGSIVWGRETRTYDRQGHLLTWQQMGYNGWSNHTYTYDEAGNRIQSECKSNDGTTTTEEFTYDEWGNRLTFRSHTVGDEVDTTTKAAVEWQVRYYPDGIPEQVQEAIDSAMSE